MTRASLLHILDHVSEISDAEIRELEQLAAAFPYCQTAHILLAKAAHDRGSMLASQRLRRAATYATNRELLRHLLEQPAPSPAAYTLPTAQPEAFAPATTPAVDTTEVAAHEPATTSSDESVAETADVLEPQDALLPDAEVTPELTEEVEPQATGQESYAAQQESAEAPITEPSASFETVSADVVAEAPASAYSVSEEFLHSSETEQALVLPDATATTVAPEEVEAPQEDANNATEEQHQPQAEPAIEVPAADQSFVADLTQPAPSSDTPLEKLEDEQEAPAVGIVALSATEVETDAPTGLADSEASEVETTIEALVEDLLPPTAPPIRPPANAGISRFEFDLVEPALPAPSAYRLPGLEDESEEEEDFPLPTVSKTGTPVFHADADLGYALGGGSRLGYDLQPRDGYTLDLPLDSFFEPDALLLAHIAANRPKPTKSSIDLINRFLKAQPRIKSPANDSKPADEQADLSVRSTQVAPAIASESLAKIMVKQGKIDKAIEIYERLMQRQPEKKAYFADQIQQLK
ncbi:hypothetical protein [Hymenobacter wooponensis]|uniref:Uncharacterized protein n=1 Tax=Hymenobacter wooponensis TaxID=1525360 RepID=A0A4Z0MII4_9BACT|nr:hypothetical protein [Hymenobacter wooponensis]TGD79321.1 hypothetical protein EU557_13850 [Hymenobacter wooponensis]